MIRDTREHNETVTPNDFEIDRLRAALPEYFDKDGAFMLDRLQKRLEKGEISITKEGYELKFLGKSYAKYLTSTETETVVVPDLEHNSQSENKESENLYIVGDNLDALKHLLGSYARQVKCIYIDPPYNTGSDGFVYNDDFGFTPAQLVDKIGLGEDEAARVLDLQGKSSHSAWLTFMYPRLQLAKELLADDGVIFISIDDNEQSNLKLLCDEVFGEQSFLAQISVKNNPRGRQSNTSIAPTHDYVFVYARANEEVELSGRQLTLDETKEFDLADENGNYRLLGLRQRGVASLREDRPDMFFPIYVCPETLSISLNPEPGWVEVVPKKADGREGRWMWGKQKCLSEKEKLVAKIITKRNEFDIFVKDYLRRDSGDERTRKVFSIWDDKTFNQQVGTQEVKNLLGSDAASFPKPTPLLRRIIEIGSRPGDTVVDFFSGSATTADAVMQLNAENGGSRKYVMVQLPEMIEVGKPAYAAGYRTIDEIGRERIKRAAAKIKDETGADIDYGFRLYRLEEPSGQVLDQLERFDPLASEALFAGDYVSKFDLGRTPGHDTVLATWLVKDGYGLTTSVEKVKLESYELDVCGDSGYVIDTGLTSDDVVDLIRQLETGELDLSRVVVFGYSVKFSVMHELKKNLAVLKSGKTVDLIERF